MRAAWAGSGGTLLFIAACQRACLRSLPIRFGGHLLRPPLHLLLAPASIELHMPQSECLLAVLGCSDPANLALLAGG